jgi:hypothetical protein
MKFALPDLIADAVHEHTYASACRRASTRLGLAIIRDRNETDLFRDTRQLPNPRMAGSKKAPYYRESAGAVLFFESMDTKSSEPCGRPRTS